MPAAFTVSLTNNQQRLVVRLSRPLLAGVVYTNTLLPGLRDLAGNPLVDAGGAPLPNDGFTAHFTTAAFLGVTPTNGTRVVAGQNVPVNVHYQTGLGAGFFRFAFGTNPPVQVVAGPTNAAASVAIPTNALSGNLTIIASDTAAFAEPRALAPVALGSSHWTATRTATA